MGSIGQPHNLLLKVFRHQLEGVVPCYRCGAAFNIPLYLYGVILLCEGYGDLVISLAVYDGDKEFTGGKINPRVRFGNKKNNRVHFAASLLY